MGEAKAMSARFIRGRYHTCLLMMNDFLTEEEQKLVKRARNKRATSRPKNADPRKYKLATGFEALIGALHMDKDDARLEEVLAEAVRIIEED